MPETQLILDWRLAQGLTFTRAHIARVAPSTVPRVDYLRNKLGFTRTFTHSRTTLGQAVIYLMLLRAMEVPPTHALPMCKALANELDDTAIELPQVVGLTFGPPCQYWKADDVAGVIDQVGRLDRLMTILFVPILIEHLANGLPPGYCVPHADTVSA
jgi:hypothetical protein